MKNRRIFAFISMDHYGILTFLSTLVKRWFIFHDSAGIIDLVFYVPIKVLNAGSQVGLFIFKPHHFGKPVLPGCRPVNMPFEHAVAGPASNKIQNVVFDICCCSKVHIFWNYSHAQVSIFLLCHFHVTVKENTIIGIDVRFDRPIRTLCGLPVAL